MRLVTLALPLLMVAACSPDNGGYDTAPPADAPSGVAAEAPSVPAAANWSGDFDLIGTEPFWGVQIRAGGLSLTRPDAPPLLAANPGAASEGEAGVWATSAYIVRLTPGG
jgi:uncharacterized membrane protein